ncbi:hypothetical protein M434DRAFT_385816 [Hypoxylon sp. CO27-5]|nr:hypothetical protein M434DRAFT_385816 [Hypoxylon sp. CO27-5]
MYTGVYTVHTTVLYNGYSYAEVNSSNTSNGPKNFEASKCTQVRKHRWVLVVTFLSFNLPATNSFAHAPVKVRAVLLAASQLANNAPTLKPTWKRLNLLRY